jgi:cytochrome c556
MPIGYDGVEREEGKRIAKALAELPGPIYVHCHHGKHRSAAALAVACVMNGQLKPEQAESVLRTFGTGVNYLGLWKAARDARPLDAKELAETKVQYVERAKIPELAKRMVAVDQHNDHLKAVEKAGWTSPPGHPDLDPAHEALQLEEHLREAARTDDTKARPADFRKQLTDAEAAAAALREALSAKPVVGKTAAAAFKTLGASCASCHKSFRD